MSPSEHEPTPESNPVEQPVPTSGLASVERRRSLLRGLSAGAAMSGAALPMAALATGSRKSCFHKDDINRRKCKATVSSMGSPIASAQVNDWPESPGKHCSHYQNVNNWPYDSTGKYCFGFNGAKYRRDHQYKTVFSCPGGGYNDWTIGQIMDHQPNCPQRHWVAALLNSTKFGSQFSYTAQQIVALHNDSSRNLDAQVFFRYYQENYN